MRSFSLMFSNRTFVLISCLSLVYYNRASHFLFLLWRLYPIPGHGLPLRGFETTLAGHTALGRTLLDEWSARRRDLYLTTHNTHKRQTSIPRRDSNPQSQQVSGRRRTSRRRDHWDRQPFISCSLILLYPNGIQWNVLTTKPIIQQCCHVPVTLTPLGLNILINNVCFNVLQRFFPWNSLFHTHTR
jgi:hypothetical protein